MATSAMEKPVAAANRKFCSKEPMRTKLGICLKKARYDSEEEAWAVIRRADIVLRPYRCALCRKFHLTSRTKGKRIRPPVEDTAQNPA